MYKNKRFITSFNNALNGLKTCVVNEKNARFHLIATIIVLSVATLLRLSKIDWLFLFLSIILVWISELINSSFESLFDLLQPEIDPRVKIGKDLSAAAVLISALFSVIVGILTLGPPIFQKLTEFFR